jgi:hypothetical protein
MVVHAPDRTRAPDETRLDVIQRLGDAQVVKSIQGSKDQTDESLFAPSSGDGHAREELGDEGGWLNPQTRPPST